MNTLQARNIKLAVQKEGRLTEETIQFLRYSGLEFESYKQRLFTICRNFPLEIIYVRNSDIPDYVMSGTVDLGIVGQNLLNEERPVVKKLLNLRFGFCQLSVAVPKESTVKSIEDLKDTKVATSYSNSAKYFFKSNNIPVEIIKINGSVEIAPGLGLANAIVDLVSTGSTLALNDLRILTKIYDSEAVLIAKSKSYDEEKKQKLIEKLLIRFSGVLSAKNYKYIMMNVPKVVLPKIIKIMPGLKSPTVNNLIDENYVSVQSVIREDVFWETIEKLKKIGAEGIIVLPIEKIIT